MGRGLYELSFSRPSDVPRPDDPGPGPTTVARKALFSSPSIFSILKWKTVEQGAEACARWRDIVFLKFHILRSYARLISRSLQLVVNEIYRHFQTLGMPSMLGVRDMLAALGRTLPVWCTVGPDEADMADMFWHIPKSEVVPFLNSLFDLLEREKRGSAEFFSLHKSGEKTLDRLGTTSSDDVRVLTRAELVELVTWDLNCNTGLTLGPLLLPQEDRGVPISGHLSAQLAELWALARELRLIFCDNRAELITAWTGAVKHDDLTSPSCIGDVKLTVHDPVELCHTSPSPFHVHHRVLASTDRASVHRGILRWGEV